MSSQYPTELNKFFKNLEVHGNPWEINWQKRADWAKDLDVPIAADKPEFEVLYWVGCIGALDDSGKKISRAMASLLNKAGVNYAILGNEERCNGDSARRIGNEMLFQVLAEMNIETMNAYGVKKIVTTCPHCYHTLKNEYPRFGGEYEVIHHTDFLLNLVKEGKLKIKGKAENGKATFHDSCYLGRYNNIYEQPRELMRMAGVDIVEMEKHHDKSFCCGAGGGGMWWEETIGNRINVMRSQQAIDTGAKEVISACPFCSVMLRDGIADLGKQEEFSTFDIAEILDKVT
jgi:Fe-S oxidoreductase